MVAARSHVERLGLSNLFADRLESVEHASGRTSWSVAAVVLFLQCCEGAAQSPDPSSSSNAWVQISGTILEVGNTLLVSFGLSELLLRRRWKELHLLLAALIFLNVLLSPRVHAACSSFRMLWGWSLKEPDLVFAGNSSDVQTGDTQVVSTQLTPAVHGLVRAAAIFAGFAAVAFADLRRFRPKTYGFVAFVGELRAAVGLVLPVYLFLVMVCSCLCLVLVSVLERAGLSEDTGEEVIVYGQFYLPWSAVYWIMKKEWLADRKSVV